MSVEIRKDLERESTYLATSSTVYDLVRSFSNIFHFRLSPRTYRSISPSSIPITRVIPFTSYISIATSPPIILDNIPIPGFSSIPGPISPTGTICILVATIS